MIETERLLLRAWQEADLEPMAKISQDPKVMEFFPALQDLEETKQLIENATRHLKKYGTTLFATERKDTGEFIGFIGIFLADRFDAHFTPAFEIGWRLGQQHWGNGFAPEGAKTVMQHTFNELSMEEIVSFTATINSRSIRVMEKIGLTHNPEDDFDHPLIPNNSPLRPHVLYRGKKAS